MVLCFGDRCAPCIVSDPWLGLDVRSETFIIGVESPPLVEEEGDPVGVEITDNFDPPLWCPDDEEGVWDLTGEYCCSIPRGDNFSFEGLFDEGGLGGRPPAARTPELLSPPGFIESSSS